MKKIYILFVLFFLISITASCSYYRSASNSTENKKVSDENSKSTTDKISYDDYVKDSYFNTGDSQSPNYIELKKLSDNIWMHISYMDYNGSRTGSNGIVAVARGGLILIDTPWNNPQTVELLSLLNKVFNKEVKITIITHAHADRIGGIDTLLEKGIDVRSTKLTADTAQRNEYKKPNPVLDKEPSFSFGGMDVETCYPGGGHTKDNITVWFPQNKLLFGGCLIKAMEAKDLGNTADADVEAWPASVQKILDKYKDAKIVVPGHGNMGNLDLVRHTLELAKKQ